MPSFNSIRQANSSLPGTSKIAVFVGATSGIGYGTIQALLKHTKGSTVFVLGRSKSKFEPSLSELQSLDPTAKLIFVEAQVSLLREVDRACKLIASQTDSIDILWLSQGGLSCNEQNFTSEGLNSEVAIMYYSRICFTQRLLPLLQKSSDGRVVSVLSAGEEGPIDTSDFGIQTNSTFKSLGFWGRLKHGVTMTSLAMHELAIQNPGVVFFHTFPGFVKTPVHSKWADTMTGPMAVAGMLVRYVMIPISGLIAITPETAGEVGLYEAVNPQFNVKGKNYFRVGEKADDIGGKGTKVLSDYEDQGARAELWKHTTQAIHDVLEKESKP